MGTDGWPPGLPRNVGMYRDLAVKTDDPTKACRCGANVAKAHMPHHPECDELQSAKGASQAMELWPAGCTCGAIDDCGPCADTCGREVARRAQRFEADACAVCGATGPCKCDNCPGCGKSMLGGNHMSCKEAGVKRDG